MINRIIQIGYVGTNFRGQGVVGVVLRGFLSKKPRHILMKNVHFLILKPWVKRQSLFISTMQIHLVAPNQHT